MSPQRTQLEVAKIGSLLGEFGSRVLFCCTGLWIRSKIRLLCFSARLCFICSPRILLERARQWKAKLALSELFCCLFDFFQFFFATSEAAEAKDVNFQSLAETKKKSHFFTLSKFLSCLTNQNFVFLWIVQKPLFRLVNNHRDTEMQHKQHFTRNKSLVTTTRSHRHGVTQTSRQVHQSSLTSEHLR